MKTTKILTIVICSIFFLTSCSNKKKEDSNKENYKEITDEQNVSRAVATQNEAANIIKGVYNQFPIDCNAKTATSNKSTLHINCVSDNKFKLKGVMNTANVKGTKTFNLKSLTIEMQRDDTKYYLLKDGISVSKKFTNNSKFLNIEVLLTKDKSNSASTVKLTKLNLIETALKNGDVLDFHLVDNKTKTPLGDTNCSEKTLKFSEDKRGDDRLYNFCAAEISCN